MVVVVDLKFKGHGQNQDSANNVFDRHLLIVRHTQVYWKIVFLQTQQPSCLSHRRNYCCSLESWSYNPWVACQCLGHLCSRQCIHCLNPGIRQSCQDRLSVHISNYFKHRFNDLQTKISCLESLSRVGENAKCLAELRVSCWYRKRSMRAR